MAFNYKEWSREYRKKPEVRARQNARAKLRQEKVRAERRDEWNAKQRAWGLVRRKRQWEQFTKEFMGNPFCASALFFVMACKRYDALANSNRKHIDHFQKFLNPEEKQYQSRTWRLNGKHAIQADPSRHKDLKRRHRMAGRKYYNSGRGLEYIRQYLKNPINKLKWNLRHRLRDALKRGSFSKHTKSLVGCTYEQLVKHIESQWHVGMSWDNYGSKDGQWSLDHKRPLAAHDLSDPEQQKAACHFTNLQPMWAKDNFTKNSFWNGKKHTFKDGKALVA